jgi:hypothetical protein
MTGLSFPWKWFFGNAFGPKSPGRFASIADRLIGLSVWTR